MAKAKRQLFDQRGKGGEEILGGIRLVLWSLIPLPGGTTTACPTCQLLSPTDFPAASTA